MVQRIFCIAFIFIALIGEKVFAQSLFMPELRSVSINPETGAVKVKWNNPNDPNIMHFEISRQPFYGGVYSFNPIGSVVVPESIYIDNYTAGIDINTNRQTYRIRSANATQYSNITSMHITMTVNALYNSCRNDIEVRWTPYKQYFIDANGQIVEPHEPEGTFNNAITYEIWGYKGTGTFVEANAIKLSKKAVSGIVDTLTNLEANSNYFLFVKALLPNKDTATSYYMAVGTPNRKEPDYMVIDSIITSKGSNNLYFNIDNTTQLDTFALFRDNSSKPIYWFRGYIPDKYVDSDIQLGLSYNYFLAAYRCGQLIKQSDTVNNILLMVNNAGQSTSLKWTDFTNESSLYEVTRLEPKPNEIVYSVRDGFSFTDNVRPFLEEGYFNYCYSVKGNNGKSIARSETQCIVIQPTITMPDAINPQSTIVNIVTGRQRNQFGPVFAFKDDKYRFTFEIFNRLGIRMFRANKEFEDTLSANHFWDGRYNNAYVKEDVYIYSLKFEFKNSQPFTQNGTVTVVYQ